MSEASDPWVDPATIPELQQILLRGLLSKVRIFEARCENDDRLLQVVRVQGRPLALTRAAARASTGSPNPAFRRGAHWDHRSHLQAAWLDLNWDAYYLPHNSPEPGKPVVLQPYLLSAQCQHERLSIAFPWLQEQVNAGIRKRVITNETRFEMGIHTGPNKKLL